MIAFLGSAANRAASPLYRIYQPELGFSATTDGRLRTNIGDAATLDGAVAALNPTERISGQTIIEHVAAAVLGQRSSVNHQRDK